MRIACGQLEARDLADADRALSEALEMVAAAGRAKADLCVLPEGTYPAYVLGSEEAGRKALAAGPDPMEVFGHAARDAHLCLVVGLVTEGGYGGRSRPAAPAVPAADLGAPTDRGGPPIESGGLHNSAVMFGPDGRERARAAKRFLWHFDNLWFQPGGPSPVADGIGMLVCADGRLPEIAAGLVERGAGLLLDPTAWVTSDALVEPWNPQAEFMLRVRALENGCAAAAASKVGVEAGVAAYCGRSQVVAADGTVVAMASGTQPELLVAEVEVPERPVPPAPRTPLPPSRPRRPAHRDGIARMAVVTHDHLATSLAGHQCRLVAGPSGILGCEDLSAVVLRGVEALVPEPARAFALDAGEVIVWLAHDIRPDLVEPVARTRAAENRVFLACWRPLARGGPFIVAPSGRIMARCPRPDRPHAVAADCLLAEAAEKEMAPGSDVFLALSALDD